jgi:demethylspheroidene O-methyltransferase
VTDVSTGPATPAAGLSWVARLAASPGFQAFCDRVPGLRHVARREGRALFDLVQGFVRSQVLAALVEGGVLERLERGPATLAQLAAAAGLPQDRALILLRAGAALRLVCARRGAWQLTARGAAFQSVPGLSGMVAHHGAFYRDLGRPLDLLRGAGETELSQVWPYVFGAGAATDPGRAAAWSRLMADSQRLVAEDTLRTVDLSHSRHLMDVGGGTGAFLQAVAARHPGLRLTLFDLPAVLAGATGPFALHPGSFRDDPLPDGADTITLVRVLYDHADATVAGLLARVHAALPPGGRIVVSEPMSGGDRPDPQTDVYFALYTLAMRTGRTRSQQEVAALLAAAGFSDIRRPRAFRPFVTAVVTATK